MARAATSLPVPDSPCTSTVAELPATRASSLYTSSMAALWPTNAYGPTACGSTSGSRRGVDFEPTVVGPLSQVLQQTAGAPALAGDYENPQQRQRLPTRHCGRDRGLHANWWDHPLVPGPPWYRATSTSASSVPLPCRARI